MDCLFCHLINGEIPTTCLYEDEHVFCFPDIHPLAPVHLLIVPKVHVANLLELNAREDAAVILAAVNRAVQHLAQEKGIAESGFRLISNCGRDGRQSVDHLHFHLLGGRLLPDELA